MNEAANDSARVSGQDRKIPPARKLEKKIKKVYCTLKVHGTQCKHREHSSFQYLSLIKEKGQNLVQNSYSGVMLGTFSVDMLQVKVKIQVKIFQPRLILKILTFVSSP